MATQFFDNLIERFRLSARAFVLGPGVVDPTDQVYGHPTETFSPEEYGNYIATSNAVYTCITLRSNMLSGRPIKPYRMIKGKKSEVTSGKLVELLKKVNPFWTTRRLIEMTEKSLGLWGKAFWFCERGTSGRLAPREIWWGRPDRVRIVPDEINYISKFYYFPLTGGEPIPFEPSEVVWFRYGNPIDEYEGLSPLAAARLAADLGNAAAQSNMKLFKQGMQLGGGVFPPKGSTLTKDQAAEIENKIDKRYSGVDKAHRWAVFRYEFEMKQFGITAKDAEFPFTLNWSLEEVARAYSIPLDLVGGQRTYANVEAAERAVWVRALKPECDFLADEITEQLLPMFPGEADLIEFDLSDVEALSESENAAWERARGQIQEGAITINQWREEKGLEPVPWGDVWWANVGRVPIESADIESSQPSAVSDQPEGSSPVTPPGEQEVSTDGRNPVEENRSIRNHRGLVYGSAEHERAWRKYERNATRWEKVIEQLVRDLFQRQRDSIVAKIKDGMPRAKYDPTEPFDKKEWIKKFRSEIRPKLRDLVREFGEDALDELGLSLAFDVAQPRVARFIEQRAQRFAEEVNQTTWDELRKSLSQALEAGEGLVKIVERVEAIMAERIRSSGETIARTEVVGASNGGALEAYRQSGAVQKKTWLSALEPNRTRESHVEAHMRYQAEPIPLDEDFEVGGGAGPHPGAIGLPEEDINCLCTMQPVVEED